MTRYEAFTSQNWQDAGIAQIVVARIRDDGRAEIGFFLVDRWCLGVKDAFLHGDSSEHELRELLRDRLPEDFRERIHPACAKKMIEGAVAYAESLGIDPARDFRKAKRVLAGIDTADCPETFTYGRDGKPCYCEGPDDSPERTSRVLALLSKRLGPDGFDYELHEDDADDEYDALDARGALQMFFDDLEKPDAPTFHEFTGMVAAAHLCPKPVTPAAVLTMLWGPAGHTWKNQDELSDFTDDLRLYWNYASALFDHCRDPATPDEDTHPIDVFPEDFADEDEATQIAYITGAVMDWCKGFVRTTRAWPEAWGDALERADLKPHFDLIRAWANPEDTPENLAIISGGNSPDSGKNDRRLPNAIITLLRTLRPQ